MKLKEYVSYDGKDLKGDSQKGYEAILSFNEWYKQNEKIQYKTIREEIGEIDIRHGVDVDTLLDFVQSMKDEGADNFESDTSTDQDNCVVEELLTAYKITRIDLTLEVLILH